MAQIHLFMEAADELFDTISNEQIQSLARRVFTFVELKHSSSDVLGLRCSRLQKEHPGVTIQSRSMNIREQGLESVVREHQQQQDQNRNNTSH